MEIFDNEKNLPGVLTQIEPDYSAGFDSSQFGSTEGIIIIGTAFQGPTGQLTQVMTPEHAAYVFGKTYDTERDQEATLVASIQDAWERGARTIYAYRIGGVELYKDFDLCIDSNYKLRVSSMFPTNIGKQCYLKFDNTLGLETLRFYKPAYCATISEKKQGFVTSPSAVISTEIRLNQDYGYNRDSSLVEIINMFNFHANNNVIKLSLVDQDGNDVTNSPAVKKLPLGVIYPGVYFIGRDHSACQNITEKKFTIASKNSGSKPFTKFEDPYYRTLIINTDVNQPVPIFAKNMDDLRNVLSDVDITMIEDWDFLNNTEIPDRAFVPNEKDYEQADLSGFELYKALGSGFAITAKAEKRVDSHGNELTPRIKEAPMDDSNRIVPIVDGAYSVLQDSDIKYRVLTCAFADQKIDSKLPRAINFKKAIAQNLLVLKDYIKLTSKIEPEDRNEAKKYEFKFVNIEDPIVDNIEDIYSEEVFPVIGSIKNIKEIEKATLENGTLLMLLDQTGANANMLIRMNVDNTYSILNGASFEDKYYIVNGNLYIGVKNKDPEHGDFVSFSKVDNVSMAAKNKEYLLGDMNNHVFVYKILAKADADGSILEPLGDLKSMLSEEDEPLIVYVESLDFNTNKIIIKSNSFNNITLDELVELINENDVLGRLFKAEVTNEGSEFRTDFILEILKDEVSAKGQKYTMPADRKITYDYNMYIPYRTTDNFARQLAQHCTYTELKTAPAHGIIGCERITNLNLSNISNKVNKLLDFNFDLYAKNNLGRNMLDRNNLAYPIGKNISIPFGQTDVSVVNSGDYNYTSECAASYAGMISTLPLDQSSTNQPINLPSLVPSLTQSQLVSLTAKGIVTFKRSFTKGIVVTDGITMAPSDSVFRRLSVSRIMGAVEDNIRHAAEPYIGKQNHAANRNSLYTAIQSRFDKLVGTLIESYEFNMNVDPSKMQFGNIDIDYQIVPIYEIRNVNNTIKIKSK